MSKRRREQERGSGASRPSPRRFDPRDFSVGTKRTAKDFRQVLRRALDQATGDGPALFDELFHTDVSAVLSHLALAYEAVNAIGLHRSDEKPPQKEQAFFLLHESLNLIAVALRTLRGGSVLASDGILRQALELAAVGYDIAADASAAKLEEFLQGKLDAPKSIGVAKNV